MTSFYSQEELKELGFKSFGTNVLISRNASIYGASKMEIGSNVRVDDFCILSGKIKIGDYVHISAAVLLFAGDNGIIIEDFCSISSRTAVYAVNDDYSGEYMANPMVPEEFTNVTGGEVLMKEHSLIGSGCTVLPGVIVGLGASVGSMSLINKDVEDFSINVGIPCKKIKERKRTIVELGEKLRGKS